MYELLILILKFLIGFYWLKKANLISLFPVTKEPTVVSILLTLGCIT
jgi:hypothetical protein